jgi:hypothetical protein
MGGAFLLYPLPYRFTLNSSFIALVFFFFFFDMIVL